MTGQDVGRPARPVVLSLGSNLGDRLAHLTGALASLREVPGLEVTGVSSVYETAPWGPVEQPDFLNVVVRGTTTLAPADLLAACLAVEDAHGREREVRWGPRTLDVDVIAVGEDTVSSEQLSLPHPRAVERAFVLVPWLELDPHAVLPGWGPVRELVDALDASEVARRDDLTSQLRGVS